MSAKARAVVATSAIVALSVIASWTSGDRREPVQSVSPIIFPPSDGFIRAAHANPAHSRLRCERCHDGASRSDASGDVLAPTEASCAGCHGARVDRSEPSPTRCGYCHEGYGRGAGIGGAGAVLIPERPPPRIRFSHRVHAGEGIGCIDCHEGMDRDRDAPGARHLPTMESCHRCHGGPAPSASDDCATCHLTLPDGRLRSRFPEGELDPPAWLFDMNHDADFLVRHRWVGADHGDKCASCHEENDCADCHDGRIRPSRRIHPNDYLTIHPQMARRDDPQCTSCHSTQNFCMECHARIGVSSVSAPDVSAPGRYHPPPEVWTRGPVLHGREARRSMTTCVSCHAERDCVDCHGVSGIGGGISPHPPGFVAECGRLLRQNPRACQTCHGDTAALAAACN